MRGLRGEPQSPHCFYSCRSVPFKSEVQNLTFHVKIEGQPQCLSLTVLRQPPSTRSSGPSDSGPGDKAQFVRLHQARVDGHDADAETIGAAFGRGNAAFVKVGAVAIDLASLI